MILSTSFIIPSVEEAAALSYDILRLSSPSLKNMAGEQINMIEAGQQAVVTMSVHNNIEQEQAFVILIEMRDSTGITHQLSWQSGIIAANGDYTIGVSWMPEYTCWHLTNTDNDNICFDNYEIRTFALTSIENPQVLSAVSSTDGIRVMGFSPNPPLGQQQLDLTLSDGRKYTIHYSFAKGDGKITRSEVDSETRAMNLALEVPEDSRFTLTMPSFLYSYLFFNKAGSQPVQLAAFVDGKDVQFSTVGNNQERTTTFVFYIEQGAEELEIVGASLT